MLSVWTSARMIARLVPSLGGEPTTPTLTSGSLPLWTGQFQPCLFPGWNVFVCESTRGAYELISIDKLNFTYMYKVAAQTVNIS